MTSTLAMVAACGIAAQPELLAAIVEVESAGSALALAVNGGFELVRPPRDRADAERMASWLLAHGYNFDAGLAQVNSANFARLGLDPRSVFEPCANLRAAAAVLEECRVRAEATGLAGAAADRAALSCYNTGHLSRGIRNGYAGAVLAAASRPRPSLHWAPPAAAAASVAFLEEARRLEVFALVADRPAGPPNPSPSQHP